MKDQSRKPSNPYDPYGSENNYSPYATRKGGGFAATGSNYGPAKPPVSGPAPSAPSTGVDLPNPYAIGNNGFSGGPTGHFGVAPSAPSSGGISTPSAPSAPSTGSASPTAPSAPSTPGTVAGPLNKPPTPVDTPYTPPYTPPAPPPAPPAPEPDRPSGGPGVYTPWGGPAIAAPNPTTSFSPLGDPGYVPTAPPPPAPVNPAASGAPALANVGTDPNAFTRDQWSSAMFKNAAMAMEGNTGAWDQNQMLAALLRGAPQPGTGVVNNPSGTAAPNYIPYSQGPRGGVV